MRTYDRDIKHLQQVELMILRTSLIPVRPITSVIFGFGEASVGAPQKFIHPGMMISYHTSLQKTQQASGYL